MLKLRLKNIADTGRLAQALANQLRNGDVVLLDGEMGAGKTTLIKALAKSLGICDDVTSPTYTLVHSYFSGELNIHHADLYRLTQMSEIEDLGLDDILAQGGALLIEWGAPATNFFPGHLYISISLVADDQRDVILASKNADWISRIDVMSTQLQDLVSI